jgi:hypothetical protein
LASSLEGRSRSRTGPQHPQNGRRLLYGIMDTEQTPKPMKYLLPFIFAAFAYTPVVAKQQAGGSTSSTEGVPGKSFVEITKKEFDDGAVPFSNVRKFNLSHDKDGSGPEPQRYMLMRDTNNTRSYKMNPGSSGTKGKNMCFMNSVDLPEFHHPILMRCVLIGQDDQVMSSKYYKSAPMTDERQRQKHDNVWFGSDYQDVKRVEVTMLFSNPQAVVEINFAPPAWNKKG